MITATQPNAAPPLKLPPRWATRLALAALTALTLLAHGYHPFAEDGGLYVAGVEHTLNPALFPQYTAFVTAHLRFSLFAPALALLVRRTHLPLNGALLLTGTVTTFLTLYAGLLLLRRCVAGTTAQLAGVALLSALWTLPVAGTSLLLMDPYVTARSLSTPLSLLAIAFALDDWKRPAPRPRRARIATGWRAFASCMGCLLLAALFHPLMAACALAFVLVVRLTRLRHRILTWTLFTLAALASAAALQAMAPRESPATAAAAISRYYWFLSQWQWYELLGLAGPLAVFAALLHWRSRVLKPAAVTLLRSGIFLGCLATLLALVFAHERYATHLVARLQPLRLFLPIYAVMTLLLGATLMQLLLERRYALAAAATSLLALYGIMYLVQRATFPRSPHIELPGWERSHSNPWVQAFLWARDNTPQDALFALDAKYVNEDGEDAQTFRAWALRSALPDFSKDGGEASITPALSGQWQQGATAQNALSALPDAVRDRRLRPLGVTWTVLHSSAVTAHTCPYDNGNIKLCRLTP